MNGEVRGSYPWSEGYTRRGRLPSHRATETVPSKLQPVVKEIEWEIKSFQTCVLRPSSAIFVLCNLDKAPHWPLVTPTRKQGD